MAVTETRFDLKKIGVRFTLNRELEVRASQIIENHLEYMFRARVAIGRSLFNQECRHPWNWKEALKERFAPAWFLRRWPVRYDTHEWVIDQVFDIGQIALPDPARDVRFMISHNGQVLER